MKPLTPAPTPVPRTDRERAQELFHTKGIEIHRRYPGCLEWCRAWAAREHILGGSSETILEGFRQYAIHVEGFADSEALPAIPGADVSIWVGGYAPAAVAWVRTPMDAARYYQEQAANIYVPTSFGRESLANLPEPLRAMYVVRFLDRYRDNGWLAYTDQDVADALAKMDENVTNVKVRIP